MNPQLQQRTQRHRRTADHSAIAWIIAGGALVALLAWLLPLAFPLFPPDWTVSKEEAEALALEGFESLGALPPSPYIVTQVSSDMATEARLREKRSERTAADLARTTLGKSILAWEVAAYARDAPSSEWSYRAQIAADGEMLELRMRVAPDEELPSLDEAEARARAERFLTRQGLDIDDFGTPEPRRIQLQERTDLVLRYPRLRPELGAELPDGFEVLFSGDRLTGFRSYLDDPNRAALQSRIQPVALIQTLWIFAAIPLVLLVAVPFIRLYHAGEVGVERGLQVAAVVVGSGVLVMALVARTVASGWSMGVLTRPQVTWIVIFQMVILYFTPLAIVSFLSWSVGETLCRESAGRRLASFDALFRGDWMNRTFAGSSLRGLVAGLGLTALLALLAVSLRQSGVWAPTSLHATGWWQGTAWFSVSMVAFAAVHALYAGLFGRLLVLSFLQKRLGAWLGTVIGVVVAAFLFFPLMIVFPMSWGPVFWIVESAALAFLFLRYGLWVSILAHLTAAVAMQAGPLIDAGDPAIRFQAALAFLLVASPCVVSLRFLWSDRAFVYRYEDIPPHVKRIAERERQKVELETARRIQTSILPELPPQLNGVEMSHSYLPATEVGGDFYDVLALEDGRLAVAVGDVAGHGVSSGLVMSMAKSALAVQVAFDPEVESVFTTLNRMVYQSARKRLLATLCYALIDPKRREMFYASAGHLFPYRISSKGDVEALESVSYPLGVRDELAVRVRASKLQAGDYLFLFSDGVVEARREGSDEPFGFDRLERSLLRHSGGSVADLRVGVLADLETFTGGGPREDDLTVLVLRVP